MMLSVFILIASLGADVYGETFEEANRAYYVGDYAAAIHGYEQLTRAGVREAALFHNLGNTYYRLGQLGRAIANYERALASEPGLTAARENLDRAVGQTQHMLPRPRSTAWIESFLFWDGSLGYRTVRAGAIVFWIAFWAGAALWLRKRLPYHRAALGICLLLAALLAASTWHKRNPPRIAVAVEAEVPVRFGMSDREKQRYTLAEGDRVRVEEVQQDWVRIATASGERGWARASSFLFVFPPYQELDVKDEARST